MIGIPVRGVHRPGWGATRGSNTGRGLPWVTSRGEAGNTPTGQSIKDRLELPAEFGDVILTVRRYAPVGSLVDYQIPFQLVKLLGEHAPTDLRNPCGKPAEAQWPVHQVGDDQRFPATGKRSEGRLNRTAIRFGTQQRSKRHRHKSIRKRGAGH